jgi:SanA protein
MAVTTEEGGLPAKGGGRRRKLRWALAAALVAVAALAAMHERVARAAHGRTFAIDEVPAAECILVPGARILDDGTPYHMLEDRLTAAFDLFAAGKAKCIVLSGHGGGGLAVDEVASMRRWLRARGVPDDAMCDDPLGLRTIDTMRRCRDEFGFRSAIVVSNPFHVPRCLFLAQQAGLDAYGVEAPYGHDYSAGTMAKNRGREVLARIWAWCEMFVFG